MLALPFLFSAFPFERTKTMPKDTVYDNEFAVDEVKESETDPFADVMPGPAMQDRPYHDMATNRLTAPKPGHWITTRPNEVGAAVHMICARCGVDEIHARIKDNRGTRKIEGYAAFYRQHMKCEEKP
jgi:hypothetical protein